MNEIKTEKIAEKPYISNNSIVKFKECGNVAEIMYSSKSKPTGSPITKLNKDLYILNETGEVHEYNHLQNRSQDLKSVARTMAMGRDIINSNITDVSYCRWITLTYAENMTDTKKLFYDFKNLIKKLHKLYGDFEYITCNEPQGRGAWHIHMIMIFSEKAPYIPNFILSKAWGKGFVTIKKLDDVDNVGAYLTAYLGDLELHEYFELHPKLKKFENSVTLDSTKNVEYIDENGQTQTKRFIKGARLYMYPPSFRIFRWSKGIKKPLVSYMTNEQAEKKVSSAKLTYEKTVALSDEEKNFNATLNYRYYNSIK